MPIRKEGCDSHNMHIISNQRYISIETETSILRPIIYYLTDSYDKVKNLSLKNKIRNNRIFSQREIKYFVLSQFMVAKNDRTRIVNDVCLLIEEIKKHGLYDDSKMYFPLVLAINQYVSDENEREKLIEMLTMDEPVDEIYEKVMSSGIFERGLEQGTEEGKFQFALKYK